ncbi:MAG: glycosyltransferase [Verrucomicrobiaceae bacterium]|nr:glycosyltransferase [Verrucomicrobiaceae bacterium]
MMTSTISCIIPTFNRRQVLVRTVEMLLDQTSPARDIVVVDQSTDIPPDVGAKLKAWHEAGQIKWVRQEGRTLRWRGIAVRWSRRER